MALPIPGSPGGGLTGAEVRERLRRYGPNAVPEERPRPVLLFLSKLWGPVPWMLEITLLLELALGKVTQTVIIAVLLLLNATLSFVQENRARNALALLRRRLTVQVRAFRDGRWQLVPAQDLVPGDMVHVRVGDFVPADLDLQGGSVLLDQSALTGESVPNDAGPGGTAFAGSVVRRGEATGVVHATGPHTAYGKTAELVHAAGAPGRLEAVIFNLVRYLVALDVLLVLIVLVDAPLRGIPLAEAVPFALIVLIASVPVALPATFTLATALGAQELARHGVLVTHLAAIEEAAALDVLCSDKTGTLTRNELSLAAVRAYPPHTEADVLRLAALACDEATQDPIDLAILRAAHDRGLPPDGAGRLRFLPFDPATKRSEAFVADGKQTLHVVKGAPQAVAPLTDDRTDTGPDVDTFAANGCRVLAVAAGPDGGLRTVGLVALHDPPREDSAAVVAGLGALGVRVLMITGDGPATARATAAEVGIKGKVCPAEVLRGQGAAPAPDCAVFAGVLPEDKFRLVQELQQAGHVVGMTGDGVNDAPALKQAEVGIAVASATDVAKAAASLVLTNPGLTDALAAVETGRRIYQRLLTYTLNKVIKTFQVALFLTLGLLLTGVFVTTPRLILLLLFANDFVTMSLATDRVSFSPRPDRWRIRSLVGAALVLAAAWLMFSFAVFLLGRDVWRLDLQQLQTLVFVLLVFTGQGTVYLVRERGHLWGSRPSGWLLLSTAADVTVVTALAARGILMSALPLPYLFALFLLVALAVLALDSAKIVVFRRLQTR
jgi:H+-transporting ATPase